MTRITRAPYTFPSPRRRFASNPVKGNSPHTPTFASEPLRRLHELFPQARITADRVTLAPPLARLVCRWHPALYGVFNAVPLLRTHLLAWAHKKP